MVPSLSELEGEKKVGIPSLEELEGGQKKNRVAWKKIIQWLKQFPIGIRSPFYLRN